jgi:hypothetical protein
VKFPAQNLHNIPGHKQVVDGQIKYYKTEKPVHKFVFAVYFLTIKELTQPCRKGYRFSVPSQDVTNQTLPDWE